MNITTNIFSHFQSYYTYLGEARSRYFNTFLWKFAHQLTLVLDFFRQKGGVGAEVSAGADNLHLSRYLHFFSFTSQTFVRHLRCCQKCQFEVKKDRQVLLLQSKAEDMHCKQVDSAEYMQNMALQGSCQLLHVSDFAQISGQKIGCWDLWVVVMPFLLNFREICGTGFLRYFCPKTELF